MTAAAAAAHQAALLRHRQHRARMKAEREQADAQAAADQVHANEAAQGGQ
jgi:hypothetical protein